MLVNNDYDLWGGELLYYERTYDYDTVGYNESI